MARDIRSGNRRRRKKAVWRWAGPVAAAFAVGAFVLAPHARRLLQTETVRYWQGQLAKADDQHAAACVGRIAALGEHALPALAQLLGDARPLVAETAEQQLFAQFERWRSLPPSAALARATLLLESLADEIDRFDEKARQAAEEFARLALDWPPTDDQSDHERLLAACDQILRRRTPGLRGLATDVPPPDNVPPTQNRAASFVAAEAFDAWLLPPEQGEEASLPLVELPADLAGTNHLRGDSSEPPPLDLGQIEESARLESAPPADESPTARPASVDDSPVDRSSPSPVVVEAPRDERSRVASHRRPSTPRDDDEEPLFSSPVMELMRALHSADRDESRQAERELEEAGFNSRQLDMARRLTSPDPAARLRLLDEIPVASGIRATSWLLILSHDEDPRIRLQVVAVMASGMDSLLHGRIARMARDDAEERVRQRAERALKFLREDFSR